MEENKNQNEETNKIEEAVETVKEETENAVETVQEDAAKAEEIIVETNLAGKKSAKPVVIGVAAAAVIALGSFAAIKMNTKDPKTVVIDAFEKVYSKDQKNPAEEIFGFTELYKAARTTNMEGGMKLQIDSMADEDMKVFEGAGFSLDENFDVVNKQIGINMGAQYGGMDLVTANLYVDNDKILASSPELSKKLFTMDYRKGIPANSVIGKALSDEGMKMDLGGFMDYIWSFYGEDAEQKFDIAALWDRYKTGSKAIEDFKSQMTAVKAKDKASFTINGTETACPIYDVTITKDACVKFVEDTSSFFLEDETIKKDILEYLTQMYSLVGADASVMNQVYGSDSPEGLQKEAWGKAQDTTQELVNEIKDNLGDTITMKVYVDKKGNLAAFDATCDWGKAEDVSVLNLHAELQGGTYPTQNSNVTLTVSKEEKEIGTISLKKQGTYDAKALTSDLFVDIKSADAGTDIGLTYTGSYYLDGGDYHMEFLADSDGYGGSVSLEGTIEDLEKGKALTMNIDELSVKMDNEVLGTGSGVYYLRPLEGSIEMPAGDNFDMMTATEDDWKAVADEISTNSMGLLFKVMGLAQ